MDPVKREEKDDKGVGGWEMGGDKGSERCSAARRHPLGCTNRKRVIIHRVVIQTVCIFSKIYKKNSWQDQFR